MNKYEFTFINGLQTLEGIDKFALVDGFLICYRGFDENERIIALFNCGPLLSVVCIKPKEENE